jgi:hypothetical protein
MVWTGTEMIVWGGITFDGGLNGDALGDGARYDPSTDTWRTMSTIGSPTARFRAGAVWTGIELLIWGGDSLLSSILSRQAGATIR